MRWGESWTRTERCVKLYFHESWGEPRDRLERLCATNYADSGSSTHGYLFKSTRVNPISFIRGVIAPGAAM